MHAELLFRQELHLCTRRIITPYELRQGGLGSFAVMVGP